MHFDGCSWNFFVHHNYAGHISNWADHLCPLQIRKLVEKRQPNFYSIRLESSYKFTHFDHHRILCLVHFGVQRESARTKFLMEHFRHFGQIVTPRKLLVISLERHYSH